MSKLSKNSHGNDQIIADFFKKSLKIIIGVVLFLSALYFYINRSKQEVQVIEQSYQSPTILKQETKPPVTHFSEQAEIRGIDFIHNNGATGDRMLPETMGSGVAFFDYDNDGDQDVLFANGTQWPWDKEDSNQTTQQIYENNGKGYFKNVTSELGLNEEFYGTGIAIGDVDKDGFDDVFIAAIGNNRLYMNQSGKKFQESKTVLDCTKDGWSTSSGFFDYDNDGDLDLMVLNYVQWSRELDLAADYKLDGIGRAYGPPNNFPGSYNCLFENQDGQLVDVTHQAGLVVSDKGTNELQGKSLALVFLDVNSDGWQDVMVANDTTKNFVFINQRNKTFKEKGTDFGLAYDASGKATGAMGLDTAHYKNNDDTAITVGNFANEMTSFYVSRSQNNFFTDESVITGIGPQSRLALSFGLFFFDYDLDGRLDFFQTNGHVENDINNVQSAQHYAQKSQLFWNCGIDCERTYVPVDNAGDINQLDLVGRAAAYADIDNDGDLDVVVTQVARKPKLFINESKTGNWIGIRLAGNNSLYNAKIKVYTTSGVQTISYSPTKSYLSQIQKGKIIGLGNDKVTKIVVSYHNGEKSFDQVKLNSWHTISIE